MQPQTPHHFAPSSFSFLSNSSPQYPSQPYQLTKDPIPLSTSACTYIYIYIYIVSKYRNRKISTFYISDMHDVWGMYVCISSCRKILSCRGILYRMEVVVVVAWGWSREWILKIDDLLGGLAGEGWRFVLVFSAVCGFDIFFGRVSEDWNRRRRSSEEWGWIVKVGE